MSGSDEEPFTIPAKRVPKEKVYPDYQMDDIPDNAADRIEAVPELQTYTNGDDFPPLSCVPNKLNIVQSENSQPLLLSKPTTIKPQPLSLSKPTTKPQLLPKPTTTNSQASPAIEADIQAPTTSSLTANNQAPATPALAVPLTLPTSLCQKKNSRRKYFSCSLKYVILEERISERHMAQQCNSSPQTPRWISGNWSSLKNEQERAAFLSHFKRLGGIDAVDMVKKIHDSDTDKFNDGTNEPEGEDWENSLF
ncbi:uncharacterized protein [Nothobranchius furzeri]|uniref:uncharacterized protein n=1 Tax=Nothobranchius furzeri TaxID=105023 RepID=UPI003904A589